ncbi:MAG TPA: hypothetical protein DEO84_08390 [candidate division Zixibacteria bacterium]|nr:hypothetical protein [candidate division Zixibacteria bacterium]HBZ01319.1 hypothetical protein [candidate division Zixibacteria bacterium]
MIMKKTQKRTPFAPAIRLIVVLLCTSAAAPAQPTASTPIPAGAQIVFWMNAAQISQDSDLRASVLENSTVGHCLNLLSLDLAEIDRIVLFMPFDKSWVNGTKLIVPQALPKNGAIIITGSFDAKTAYQGFKAKGWKEISYSNKKLLWWSKGTSYYCDPKSGACIAQLPGGGLIAGGSEGATKNVLDVAGGKAQSFAISPTFERLSQDFNFDKTRLLSLYVLITPDMRAIVKSDTSAIKSSTGKAAIGYIDYLEETGLSVARSGNGFGIEGYLGMDSESNSLIVSSIFQIGGGLASLLPPNDPNRSILENLSVSRQGKLVILQSNLTRRQLQNLMRYK